MTKPKRKSVMPSLPHSGNVAQTTLDNGIRVYAYENFASPAVVMSGILQVGARDEAPERAGLAGFVADCLSRGTQKYSYEKLFELPESIGAGVGVSSAMHTSGFYAKSLSEDMPLMLELLGEMLMRPTFPKAQLEKERAEWLSALEERQNSTSAMCGLAFNEMCYPEGHPYRRDEEGYTASVRAITRKDAVDFHRKFYSPQGMSLVVVGAVKAAEAFERVAAALGGWRNERPTRAAFPITPKVQGQPTKRVTMPGKMQANVIMGLPGPARNDPDWRACVIMNSIFGEFGMYGRLGASVRKEEGLVYSIGSSFAGGPVPGGAWTLSAGTHPGTVARVIEIARAEIRRIQDKKVTPRELADNKSYFIGSLPLAMETNEGIAGQIVNMVRYNLGLDYLLGYPDAVNAITQADIQRVAQTWLDADNFALASAGP